jgi:hypothetical protein
MYAAAVLLSAQGKISTPPGFIVIQISGLGTRIGWHHHSAALEGMKPTFAIRQSNLQPIARNSYDGHVCSMTNVPDDRTSLVALNILKSCESEEIVSLLI